LDPYLKDKEFDPEFIRSKSAAAAGLCSWVINIVKFFEVYCDVEPKRRALEEANAELVAAQDKLAAVKQKVNLTLDMIVSVKAPRMLGIVQYFAFQKKVICFLEIRVIWKTESKRKQTFFKHMFFP
jgi:hypothetical protein